MTHPSLWRAAFVSVALVAPLACGSDSPLPPTQPGEPVRTLRSLAIEGPASVAPGETIRYVAMGTYSDGAREDLSGSAVWRSQSPSIAAVDETGAVTGRERGSTTLTAWSGGRTTPAAVTSSRSIIVVPAGTYRLNGRVVEADTGGGVRQAKVEVTSGGGSGLFTATNEDGRYELYGVNGPVEVLVTRAGYEPQMLRLSVSDHTTADARLALTEPRPAVNGTYELRLTLDSACGQTWPEAIRTRRYRATLEQTLNRVLVTLSGASFAPDWSGRRGVFEGRVEPPGLVFTLSTDTSQYYRSYADITEILDRGAGWIVVGGRAEAAVAANGFAGTVEGPFVWYLTDPLTTARENGACIGRHGFVLTRSSN